MKKYIKILGLLIVLLVQSCERSSTDLISDTESETSIHVNEITQRTFSKEGTADSGIDNLDTDDKEEPKRDKSHWRIAKDTITKW